MDQNRAQKLLYLLDFTYRKTSQINVNQLSYPKPQIIHQHETHNTRNYEMYCLLMPHSDYEIF